MNNHRQLISAVRMYANEFKDVLPFVNSNGVETGSAYPKGWGGQPGWLYQYPNLTKQEDVQTGLLWKYLKSMDVYHCPFDPGPYTYNVQKLSSYLMNREILMDTKYGPYPSWKLSKFRANDVLFWEVSDTDPATGKGPAPSGYWNDGANYYYEGITMRHGGGSHRDPRTTGSIIGCFGGTAELIIVNDFNKEANIVGGRVQCGPPARKFQRY